MPANARTEAGRALDVGQMVIALRALAYRLIKGGEEAEGKPEMGKLDEAIADLEANIADLTAGFHTPNAQYVQRANAAADAHNDNAPPPPPPPPPPAP